MKNEMKLLYPNPIYIATDIVSEDANRVAIEECERLRKATTSQGVTWDCDVYCSMNDGNLFENDVLRSLHETIGAHVNLVASQFVEEPVCEGTTAWFNMSGEGQYQESHIHQNSHFSAVYYIKTPEGSGPTVIGNPYQRHMLLPREKDNDLNAVSTYVPAVERSLVVFQSFMPHYVPKGANTDQRITHASNWSIV